jgi:hypothetical protein
MSEWVPVFTTLAGVVLGFALSFVGGLIHDERRAVREFHAAVLVVSDELQANIRKLEIAIRTAEEPEPLASQTYDAYQLILGGRLSPDARDAVRSAYLYARVQGAFQVRSADGEEVRSTQVVRGALQETEHAHELLHRYIPHIRADI